MTNEGSAASLSAEEVAMFRKTLDGLLARDCGTDVVRAAEETGMSYASALWAQLAELGFLGLPFPAEDGGIAAPWEVTCLMIERLGGALAPAPIIPSIFPAGVLIARCKNPSLREAWLPHIVEGDRLVVCSVGPDPFAQTVEANATALGFELRGEVRFLPLVDAADAAVVVGRQASGESHLCLVAPVVEGFDASPSRWIDGERLWDVRLTDVPVVASAPLATEAYAEAIGLARLTHAAWMVGAGQGALDRSVAYAKERIQFGRPIGAFQALQHRMADAALQLEAARRLVKLGAATVERGGSAQLPGRAARLLAAQAFTVSARAGQQVHGGYGYAEEADIQLYYRRAARAAFILGDSTEESVEIGRLALDHPDLIGGLTGPVVDEINRIASQ